MVLSDSQFTRFRAGVLSRPRYATKLVMTSFLPAAILRSAGAPAERRVRGGRFPV